MAESLRLATNQVEEDGESHSECSQRIPWREEAHWSPRELREAVRPRRLMDLISAVVGLTWQTGLVREVDRYRVRSNQCPVLQQFGKLHTMLCKASLIFFVCGLRVDIDLTSRFHVANACSVVSRSRSVHRVYHTHENDLVPSSAQKC